MYDYKSLLGALAIVVGLVGYIPYFRDIFRKRTKPHAFSWFVWGILTAIAFFAQVTRGGGPGTWVTGITALACLVISGLALFYGERDIKMIDWLSLLDALVGIVFWVFTNDPFLAVILVTVIDAVGYIPTFRKGFHKPYEETISTFFLSSLKFLIALFALRSLNLITWLYPASLVLTNAFFVAMLISRRRSLSPTRF